MPANPDEFRERLFNAQEIDPTLRERYRGELDTILHERPTRKSRFMAITLLVICLAVVAGEIRALIIHRGEVTFYVAAVTMLLTCGAVAAWIIRDLLLPKVPRASAYRVADLFYGASWILVVVQLLKGMHAPADPASTFGVLFVFTFAAVCTSWSIANRIAAAELSAREQALRLECRLADLAQRLPKYPSPP
jgi:hypothetical protein